MARYNISKESLTLLDELADNLTESVSNINIQTYELLNLVTKLGDTLGVYQKGVLKLIKDVIAINDSAQSETKYLIGTTIPAIQDNIRFLLSHELGSGEESDDDEDPAIKKLVLKLPRRM